MYDVRCTMSDVRCTQVRKQQAIIVLGLSYIVHLTSYIQRFCFFISSTIYSEALMERAKMVQVIFLSACETNCPPSTQNKFLQSCAWLHLLSADLFASSPILTVPASWMISPGLARPH